MDFLDVLNNREKALIFWLLVLVVWIIYLKDSRRIIPGLVKQFFSKHIFPVVVLAVLYTGLLVWLYNKVGFWDSILIKDTIFWFVGTAFVHLLNIDAFIRDASHFKKILKDSVKLIIVLEFIANLYAFGLLIELILLPIIVTLVGISTIADRDQQYKPAKKVVDSILGTIGLSYIAFALINIFSDFQGFMSSENLRAFLLPIWLTIAYLVFVYVLALYAAYESFFVHLRVFLEQRNKELARYAKWKTLIFCNINLARFNKFTANRNGFLQLRSKDDMDALIRDFKNRQSLESIPGD